MSNLKRLAVLFVVLAAFSGALEARTRKGEKYLKEGRQAEAAKQWEVALDLYEKALLEDPADAAYLLSTRRVRFQAAQTRVDAGRKLRKEGRLEESLNEFQRAYAIDPGSIIAEQELKRTREMIEREQSPATQSATPEERGLTPAEKAVKEAEEKSSRILAVPELRPINRQPLNLRMNNQPPKILFDTVGKLAGINVIFDPEYQALPGKNFTVDLTNTTLEQALDYVAIQTKSYWKPLSENSIFVTNDNVTKRRDYEDFVVKVFYIKNANTVQELQEISTTVRSVTEIRRAFTYNPLNAILLRGTADQIALAEKLIQDLDKPRAEVVVDVIVMEANRSRVRDLAATFTTGGGAGINIPVMWNRGTGGTATPGTGSGRGDSDTSTGGATPTTPINNNTGNLIRLPDIPNIRLGDFSITAPGALVQALMSDSQTRVLQQPQVRAVETFKASLKIGDRIPYATGSFQPGVGSVGLNPLVSTQFNFLDTGVNVDMVPKVHGRDEVSLHVEIDVSTKSGEVELGGLRQPIVSRRTVMHDIRIKEGEATVLGGLLGTQDTKIRNGIPGLMDIPGVGRLFSTEKADRARGELLIVLIPRVVRTPDFTEANLRGVSAGNDQNVKLNYSPRTDLVPAPGPSTAAPVSPGTQSGTQPAIQPGTPSGTQQPGTAPAPGAAKPDAAIPEPAKPDQPKPLVEPEAAASPVRMLFNPAVATAQVATPVTVSLQLENVRDLFTAPMRIRFDPKVLRLTSVRAGALMTGDGQRVNFSENTMNDTGEAVVTLNRMPGSGGVSGSGTLLTLTFQAAGPGTSRVEVVDASLTNMQLQPVTVAPAALTVTVQ